MTINLQTAKIKRDLWRYYGQDSEWKAEWDGASYLRGGKLSQRMWEYFITAELLDLPSDATVLDIGGGSPFSGKPFFADLIAPYVKRVIVMDPNQSSHSRAPNVQCLREDATTESLTHLFQQEADISHVCSISVFEHVPLEDRVAIIRTIDQHFRGSSFVATYEYHPVQNHFEHQLTAETVSQTFSPFQHFYLDQYLASPTHCVNAFTSPDSFLRGRLAALLRRLKLIKSDSLTTGIPQWYPCAVRFLRG